MKILAASDVEGDTRAVKKLAEKAEKENVDLVLLCGDITDFDMNTEGMIGPFLEKNKKVAFVSGNHDMPAATEFLTEKYKIPNIQYHAFKIDNVGFFGCGGVNVNLGFNVMDDETMFNYIKRGFTYIEDAEKKILVTHLHSADSTADKEFFIEGSGGKGIKAAIDVFKPDIHLSGHMHEFEGAVDYIGKTKLMSVGKNGTIFEI
ncbi:metallophosphoesterase [Candidatus Aenigmatarchaeota archaeon]